MKSSFKKIFYVFLFLLLLVTFYSNNRISVNAFEYQNFNFSNITEEESISFVIDHNVNIPSKIEHSENLGAITQSIIQKV